MAFPKGYKSPATGKGRPPGAVNKTTALLKDAILQAATQAHHDGLVGYLTQQAQTNSGPFMALLGKVLPMQIQGDKSNPLVFNLTIGGEPKE